MKSLRRILIFMMAFSFFSMVNGQENLNLSAPDIQPNPLPSVTVGGTGCFSFVVQNVNGFYDVSCGASITIMMTDIAPTDGANSVSSNLGGSTAWTWMMDGSNLVGTQSSFIGFLYSETITVCFDVTADSAQPGSNGFSAMVSTGSCADGNTTDNVAASTTWTDVPLSVELLQFEVNKRDQDAILDWATTSETNNEYFDVQRSFDGIKFESIGKIDGAGTSQEAHQYQYIDEAVMVIARARSIPNIFYRIEQFDFDGTSVFSPIKSLPVDLTKDERDLTIYPNPASDFVQVSYPGSEGLILTVYDELGQVVESVEISNNERITTESWLPGTYIVELKENGVENLVIGREKLIVVK